MLRSDKALSLPSSPDTVGGGDEGSGCNPLKNDEHDCDAYWR